MGGLFFLAFIIFLLKNIDDRRRSDIIRAAITLCVVCGLIAVLEESGLLVLAIIGALIFGKIKRDEKKKREQHAQQYGWDAAQWDRDNGNKRTDERVREERRQQSAERRSTPPPSAERRSSAQQNPRSSGPTISSAGLTPSVRKRSKIVEAFNKKYDLCLTEEQIKNIVNASYMSEIWKREIIAMDRKYNIVHQWFTGPTAWLRVYMHAFHVQEITADIREQESIAMYAFEAIFKYVETLDNMSRERQIELVNRKFLTDFDDFGFMIAYRFLEEKGLHHELPHAKVTHESSDVDDLLEKYAPQQGK